MGRVERAIADRIIAEPDGIIKFTLISVITGVVRTTVVFWLPTYISQYLGYSTEQSALIYTASTMHWSRYCPGLRDTGMVSSATGFLDFMSYMAASISSTLFANAVSDIGWGNLILVWFGLMLIGVLVAIPHRKRVKNPT